MMRRLANLGEAKGNTQQISETREVLRVPPSLINWSRPRDIFVGFGYRCAQRPGAGEQVAFAEAGIGTKAGIGRYIVSKKDDLVFVYDTRVGANGGADGEEKVLTAFFRAPIPIVSVSCAGDKIAVGCQSGAVLTLHAAWLAGGGAA